MKEVKAAVRPSKESVSSADALGRVAAADARARFSSPHYDSAAMDGIAVKTVILRARHLRRRYFSDREILSR